MMTELIAFIAKWKLSLTLISMDSKKAKIFGDTISVAIQTFRIG